MYGNNPIRPPVKGDGQRLDIVEIFKTFQGEGPFTGWPAVFVRLGGCNLACDFCDTEFEQFTSLDIHEIQQKIDTLAGSTHRLIVITGGEPLRQPIERLCEALLATGYQVQIETNGTLWRPLPEEVDIICSPKNQNGQYFPLRSDLLSRITALKFIISQHHPNYQDSAEVGQTSHNIPVYLQPMDEGDETKNATNLNHTVTLAQKYGYRISLQTHKIAGVK